MNNKKVLNLDDIQLQAYNPIAKRIDWQIGDLYIVAKKYNDDAYSDLVDDEDEQSFFDEQRNILEDYEDDNFEFMEIIVDLKKS